MNRRPTPADLYASATGQTGEQFDEPRRDQRVRYVRVVLAVPVDENVENAFQDSLEEFIEENDSVWGAHVSGYYDTREEAVHGAWVE